MSPWNNGHHARQSRLLRPAKLAAKGRFFSPSLGILVLVRRTEPCSLAGHVAITIPHIDWIEPLRLEREDFANSIRQGTRPRAHGEVGLEVERVLAAAQEVY